MGRVLITFPYADSRSPNMASESTQAKCPFNPAAGGMTNERFHTADFHYGFRISYFFFFWDFRVRMNVETLRGDVSHIRTCASCKWTHTGQRTTFGRQRCALRTRWSHSSHSTIAANPRPRVSNHDDSADC